MRVVEEVEDRCRHFTKVQWRTAGGEAQYSAEILNLLLGRLTLYFINAFTVAALFVNQPTMTLTLLAKVGLTNMILLYCLILNAIFQPQKFKTNSLNLNTLNIFKSL